MNIYGHTFQFKMEMNKIAVIPAQAGIRQKGDNNAF